jgi:hypothetical protein
LDPTFHFDADPDPDPDPNPTPSFTHGGKSEFFKTHSGARLHCLIIIASVIDDRCHNFQYFSTVSGIFWKKYSLAFYLIKMDLDPDRQALNTEPDPPN